MLISKTFASVEIEFSTVTRGNTDKQRLTYLTTVVYIFGGIGTQSDKKKT